MCEVRAPTKTAVKVIIPPLDVECTLAVRLYPGATTMKDGCWATAPRYWTATVGDCSAPSLLSSTRVIVVLWLPEALGSHALAELSVLAQQVLLVNAGEDYTPTAIVALDLSSLMRVCDAGKLLDAEGSSVSLGEHPNPNSDPKLPGQASHNPRSGADLGEQAARALDRLTSGMSEVTLVACGGASQLLLRLLLDTRSVAVRRAVLIHPRLPSACLARLSSAAGSGAGATLRLDLLFESGAARQSSEASLRHAFPQGTAAACGNGPSAALTAHALSAHGFALALATPEAVAEVVMESVEAATGAEAEVSPPPVELYDPTRRGALGRALWLGRLRFGAARSTQVNPI